MFSCILAATSILSSCLFCQTAPPLTNPRVEWLRSNSVSVTTVASDTAKFEDLAPLKKSIGNARVVMLGELTHGDGTGFEAKARLVRFLHEEMGFDVLVWESGLFDCEQMDGKIASDLPLDQVAAMGVFGHWSAGKESFPVFEYARQTQKTKRPLRMAGFDLQVSGTVGGTRYSTFLNWFADPPVIPVELKKRITDALGLARDASSAPNPMEVYTKVDRLLRPTSAELLTVHEANEKAITAKIGKSEFAFRKQCLRNSAEFGRMMDLYERYQTSQSPSEFTTSFDLRETTNAKNLVWLLNERYKGKKLIVWAHNSHIFAGWPYSGRTETEEPKGKEMDSMGRLVKKELGDKLYTIGFMANGGKWSWMGNPTIPYTEATPDSLEGLLHKVGKPYLFLDLRPVRKDSRHWLSQPVPGCMNQQQPQVVTAVWPKGYDGIFFIDEMQPRTQRPAPSP